MKNLNKFKGFTLVEVLIVIIIIGILIAALLPRLTGVQARARDVSRKAAVSQIASAVRLANADDATNTFSGCVDNLTSPVGVNLDSVPVDPSGGTAQDCDADAATPSTANYGVLKDLILVAAGPKVDVVFAEIEGGNGNCNIVDIRASKNDSTVVLPTTETTGDTYCEIVR